MRRDGSWTIDGRKQFISNGYDASLYVVYVNTDDAAGMLQGTSSFLVPRDTPGLEVTRCNETIGGRYMNNGEIVFDACRVPEDHLLAHNDALSKAGIYFRPGKIMQAAKNQGIRMAAFEQTVGFVHDRVQGGRVLIEHQAVAIRVAEMVTKLEAVAALLRHAARSVDERRPNAGASPATSVGRGSAWTNGRDRATLPLQGGGDPGVAGGPIPGRERTGQ